MDQINNICNELDILNQKLQSTIKKVIKEKAKEVIKEKAKEVIKEKAKEVIKEKAKEVIKEEKPAGKPSGPIWDKPLYDWVQTLRY